MSRIDGIIRLSKEFLKRKYMNISDMFEPILYDVWCNRETMTVSDSRKLGGEEGGTAQNLKSPNKYKQVSIV